MSKFQVGDKVVILPECLKSHTDFDRKALYCSGDLPHYCKINQVYTVFSVGTTYCEINGFISNGFWMVSRECLALTTDEEYKAKKFAVSKNRAETRHLRNKNGQ